MLKISLVSLMFLVLSCYGPIYNLPKIAPDEVPKMSTHEQDKDLLVFMTISGGGTRAGAMGWRALEYLQKVPYSYTNEAGLSVQSNLADQIDYISGISGGSFAATGWCIYKDSMQLFRDRFVEKNIQKSLVMNLLWPPTRGWSVIAFPHYSRIDVASQYYDKNVFAKKKFRDLPQYPTLWINATNLSIANRFVYSEEQFDMMSSDLGSYPLGYACAASSAFPILLDPITLKNYGETEPDSVLNKNRTYAMAKRNSERNPEKYYYCNKVKFFNDKKNKWLHLSDGGLVDNQGLQAVIDQFENNGVINKSLNNKSVKRLMIINVNAGTNPVDKSGERQKSPGVAKVMNYTMTASMDILSAKRWVEVMGLCSDVWKAKLGGVSSLTDKPFCVEVNFRNVKNDSLRDACYNLPTSFYLKPNQVSLVDSIVPVLMDENRDLNRFKRVKKLK